MKHLPKTVKIGHLDMDIRLGTLDGLDGQCDIEGRMITLDAAGRGAIRRDTLLHECLHAIWYVYGIDDKDGEERTINCISTALTTMFRDSPKVAAYLIEVGK
jgi:hypothetical protein